MPVHGTYTDYENGFQRGIERPMQVRMASNRDVAVLRSQEWFRLDDPDTEPLRMSLPFACQALSDSKMRGSSAPLKLSNKVELPTKEVI